MQWKRIAGACLCALALAVAGCGGGEKKQAVDTSKAYLSLKDAAGRQVVLAQKPERIVSLSPSYLGMIEAVGGKIVGRATSKVGTIPESMKNVPEIGFVFNVIKWCCIDKFIKDNNLYIAKIGSPKLTKGGKSCSIANKLLVLFIEYDYIVFVGLQLNIPIIH